VPEHFEEAFTLKLFSSTIICKTAKPEKRERKQEKKDLKKI